MASTRPGRAFQDLASQELVVFDGAMGSLLYERGVFVTQNFEQLNVARPDIVQKIHAEYVAAGAQVIETNTFGANRFRLERFGLPGKVREYNLAGARNAREAAGDDAYVAGSIGPTGLILGVTEQAEQLDVIFHVRRAVPRRWSTAASICSSSRRFDTSRRSSSPSARRSRCSRARRCSPR
jgi:methionine synthase I (cobalamin-dependent)